MNQGPIEPPCPDDVDQGFDSEDQVLSALNQDGCHAGLDLHGLIQAVDDEQEIAVWPHDPPRIRQGSVLLVILGTGVRHREVEPGEPQLILQVPDHILSEDLDQVRVSISLTG